MEQERLEEVVRLVNNRDEGAVKVAIDAFVKQHPNTLLEFVNRILQDDISSQVRDINCFQLMKTVISASFMRTGVSLRSFTFCSVYQNSGFRAI